MKKVVLLLGLFSLFVLVSCGSNPKRTTNDSYPTQESTPSNSTTTTTQYQPSGVDDGGHYVDSYSWGELH